MPITITSSRFGTLEIADDAIIEFPDGIVGLPGRRWTLIARDAESDFLWLHGVDDPTVALPVTNPWLFFPEYSVEIADDEVERLGLDGQPDPDVYVTVRAAAELEDFRVNLRAPILVHGGKGHQIINQIDAPVRAPLFDQVEPQLEAA